MSRDDQVRISIPVDKDMHEQLKNLLPWGTQAEVVRSLLQVFIEAHVEHGTYIATHLIKGQCKLSIQNLNVLEVES